MPNEIKTLMYSIPTLKTQVQVFETLDKIKEFNKLEARAGLSLAFTKMNIDTWNQTPNNTNANESAHANINQDGQFLSLLAAIYQGSDFNQRQCHAAKTYEQYNVKDSYRDKSELACLIYNAKKSLHTSSELSITIPIAQEQQNYVEWEDKKFQIQQKNLELLKEEIALREKLNSLKK
ncbi:37179_t:CDS:2 [Gigaspora margarita]|uniref:37179_t:CDS:1 n=1 Tax=Gigaspora margarita TaxID=4874 RepID=A0ABN7W9L0_GIGMA|nr:37179_t:CDS:2 [Gigaspora margarita]